MKLEEAKKVLNGFYGRCKNCANEEYCDGCYIDAEDVEAISTVLQELEHFQKENEDKKTYEFGLIVGTKRERDWWQNKIREKIKEIYEDKNSEYYDMFLEQRDIEKTISILNDLLKEE